MRRYIVLDLLMLKGLCHGSPVQFVLISFSNYSPLLVMELNVSKEITCK